jgi:hypothetical protein
VIKEEDQVEFKIDQTGSHIKLSLDGLDITNAVRSFEMSADAWNRGRTELRLVLAIDQVEVTALAEQNVTIMVSVTPDAEKALQAIGWVKTSDRLIYTIPREDSNA